MLKWIARALAVALGAALLGLLAMALEIALMVLIWGGDLGAGFAVALPHLPGIVVWGFITAFLLVLLVLWPASLGLRRLAREPSQAYLTLGALVAMLLALVSGLEFDEVTALLFASWGAIAGGLYWFAFRRGAGAAPLPAA